MKFYILGPIIIVIILFVIFFIGIIQYRSLLISKKIKSYLLIPLRIISIIIILTLLLEPYLSYYDYLFKNKLNIYIDNSKSIKYNDINSDSLLAIIEHFNKWRKEDKVEIGIFIFGDSIRTYTRNKFHLNDNITNFSDIKTHIEKNTHTTNFIISDGNSTEGYKLSDLKFEYPVNFIGLGFLNYEDISITDIQHLHAISKEDSFNIKFSINSILESETNSRVIISSNKSIIYQEEILLNEGRNKYNQSIKIPSNNLFSEFDIEITSSLSTDNKFNNIYKGRIGIRDLNKDILLVSGSLNPNTRQIKDILYLIPNLSLKHIYKSKKGWTEKIEKIKLKDYSLIVYDNFPLDNEDNLIMDFLMGNSNPHTNHVIFEGPSFSLNSFNQISKELSIEIIEDNKKSKFILRGDAWPKTLPSLHRNFRVYKNIFKDIYLQYSDSTIAIAENEDYLYISIPDLSSLCLKDLSDIFEEKLSEIIYKYMDSGNSINLDIPNREVYSDQDLKFYLEFPEIYDYSNGKLSINNIDLNLKYNIKLNKIRKDLNGIRYIKNMKEGENILSVNLFSDDKIYKSNQLKLIVKKNNLESQKIYRNIEEMRDIAIKSDGNYYDIEDYNSIKPSILQSIRERRRKIEFDIHSFDKYWFILLITLIIEWFFRKRKGLL